MVGVAICLLVAAGLVTWTLVDSDPYVAPRPPSTEDPVDADSAAVALDALQRAVKKGDRAGAEALAPEGDAATGRLLSAIVANAQAIPVRDFRLRYVDETSAASGDGTWAAAVDTTWRFQDVDSGASFDEVTFRFRSDGDEVDIVGVGGDDLRTPVWLSGPLTVRRSADTLVLAAGPARRATEYEQQARAAVADVRKVLPQWRSDLVVEVPASSAALDAALNVSPGQYAGIAAVTSSTDGSTAPEAPIHVFINPTIYDRLGDTGAQVVMSHEAVHVATEAPNSVIPPWLLEGFADYVALRDVDLPYSVTAGQIIEQVRRNGAPRGLPGAAEFGSSDTHLGAAYESAWLACVVLADRSGESALVGLYAALHQGGDLDAELDSRFGWTEQAFVAAWRQRLTDLAE